MTAVLFQTLAWTGVLIAAVLVLRRPVARHFGPEAAYALWALPLLRLIVPPVELPAWMAPRPAFAEAAAAPDSSMLRAAPPIDPVTWEAGIPVPLPPAPPAFAGFDLFSVLAAWPLAETLMLVWLGGAGVFLALRFAAYFALRDQLLAEGREVGRTPGLIGKVRLIETPGTNAPLAMGVLDPVIALPPGFLALPDRAARDLALAHEMAHHRGGDLLVNVLVQPLFALHWWNPLGRYGWLALRRDQEAACDARVMARRSAHERAAYAALIARFAAAPGIAHHAALTAPMACPVLGEKSIIHRLRSLAMSDPTPRRRLAGRVLLGAGLLALPLTASITFAASDSLHQEAPAPPVLPAPPVPPAPTLEPEAPEAPPAPEPPEAPDAPKPPSIVTTEPKHGNNTEVTEHVWRDGEGKERRVRMVVREAPDGTVLSRRPDGVQPAERAERAERAEMLAELRAGLAEADRALADLPRIIGEALAEAEAEVEAKAKAARAAGHPRVMVKHGCAPGGEEVSETTGKDGTRVVRICQRRIMTSARHGLGQARAEIAGDKNIPEDTRRQILETLDRQIARWKNREG